MKIFRKFVDIEVISASLLLGATILALVVSNSSWHSYYENFFNSSLIVRSDAFQLKTSLKFLINEGLMTFFFLVVGLEIKYEFLQGSLNSFRSSLLPIFAAIGGMVVPAIIYLGLNYHDAVNLRGWAIPTATDIAFALGVLSLLGSRIQSSLKAFLTALAIIDDVIAIVIIALFYTDHLDMIFLGLSLICFILLLIMNFKRINNLILYSVIGVLLWICLFYAGIHPTLAGVALAFSIPIYKKEDQKKSPLHKLMRLLHPIVALGILPLFAFTNAGISFINLATENLQVSIILGIFLSLFLGKQLGIFGVSWLTIKMGIARLPKYVKWIELYGISVICGIGFTISLFIGTLAFGASNISHIDSVKVGVLSGSLFSGIAGYFILFVTKRKNKWY